MEDRSTHPPKHELGTAGDQDIVRGPRASDDATFVPVGSSQDPFEADLLTTALADEGIPVVARAQKDHLVDPLVNPAPQSWVLLVPAEHERKARALVEERRAELEARRGELEAAAIEEESATEGVPAPEGSRG